MTPIPTELRELLERIVAGDVGRMIYAKLATGQATETDDGKAWLELRALLATPPADAADMGGQAGEEVEVVAHIDEHDSLCHLAPRTEHFALMTVSQHRRILAQHRRQAGKLAEARAEIDRLKDQRAYLRALLNRVRLHVPLQSMPGLLGDIESALED